MASTAACTCLHRPAAGRRLGAWRPALSTRPLAPRQAAARLPVAPHARAALQGRPRGAAPRGQSTHRQAHRAARGRAARRPAAGGRGRPGGRRPRFALGAWFNDSFYPLFVQACFADPMYGGNRDKVFWRAIGFPACPRCTRATWSSSAACPFLARPSRSRSRTSAEGPPTHPHDPETSQTRPSSSSAAASPPAWPRGR